MYLADQHFEFSNTISRPYRIVPSHSRIGPVENVLRELERRIGLDHRYSLHRHVRLRLLNPVQFLLHDQFDVNVLAYCLSKALRMMNFDQNQHSAHKNESFDHELSCAQSLWNRSHKFLTDDMCRHVSRKHSNTTNTRSRLRQIMSLLKDAEISTSFSSTIVTA